MNRIQQAPVAGLFVAAIVLFLGVPQEALALNPNHNCAFCHSLHGAQGGHLSKEATDELTCLTCHGAGGSSTLKAETHQGQTCMVCHAAHSSLPNAAGGTNIKLIGRNVDGTGLAKISTANSGIRDVAFESRGTDAAPPGSALHSFADGDTVYDGVCEVCHTATTKHRNAAGGDHAHNAGKKCTNCHTHVEQFLFSCTNCHNPPGTGGADGDNAPDPLPTNKHDKHVTGKGYSCTTCHDGYFSSSTHDNGILETTGMVSFSVAYNPYATWNDGANTCASTYCHGATNDNIRIAANTPVWNTTSYPSGLPCTNCHSSGGTASFTYPEYLDQMVSTNRGLHNIHLGANTPCLVCHSVYAQKATHVDFNRMDPATPTEADANLHDDLIVFDPTVSSNSSNPDSFWTGTIGSWDGGCGGSLCHYPGITEVHDPGMVDYTDPTLGPLSGWYNR